MRGSVSRCTTTVCPYSFAPRFHPSSPRHDFLHPLLHHPSSLVSFWSHLSWKIDMSNEMSQPNSPLSSLANVVVTDISTCERWFFFRANYFKCLNLMLFICYCFFLSDDDVPPSDLCNVSLHDPTQSDFCYFCNGKLDPFDLKFNVKTSAITVWCKDCRKENEAGKLERIGIAPSSETPIDE